MKAFAVLVCGKAKRFLPLEFQLNPTHAYCDLALRFHNDLLRLNPLQYVWGCASYSGTNTPDTALCTWGKSRKVILGFLLGDVG